MTDHTSFGRSTIGTLPKRRRAPGYNEGVRQFLNTISRRQRDDISLCTGRDSRHAECAGQAAATLTTIR